MINHCAKQSPLLFSKSYMLSVHEAKQISYSYHLRCQRPRNCQKDVSYLLIGCWYTWFGHLSNIAHWISISIIKTYSIDDIDFLAPCKLLNSQITYPIWQMSVPGFCSKDWVIIVMPTIRCISGQLQGVTCNKHCCEAFIQIKWVLFCIAMNWSSRYNPIFCPAVSAELQCFEIRCYGHKQGSMSRMCADPRCQYPCFVFLPNFCLSNFGLLS